MYAAYALWLGITKILDEDKPVKEEHKKYWRIGQWFTTGFLWWTWLSHDMANIAVFLPRELPVDLMVLISAVFVAGLWWMFREGGGKIQNIVLEKHNTRYVRSATIIDGVYWIILFFFKELNDIPMSTTWVFVGLLCGRELAMATMTGKEKVQSCIPSDWERLPQNDGWTCRICGCCSCNSLCHSTKRTIGDSHDSANLTDFH